MQKSKIIQISGHAIDEETRCVHYHSDKDIIAIKFYCCQTYFPCYECHEEKADHPSQVWPKEAQQEKAILCGSCKTELSIQDYLQCHSKCPVCKSAFNPGCQLHYHLYFEK